MRLMQHKREAYWFYRFLSIFYDKFVNPLFWTERMRDTSLALADLNEDNLQVIDVGSGTGFTTQGIVQQIAAKQVTCVDQSPHQMAKAKAKADLANCHFMLGDAENIPVETDQFDRYVSAGSIEYWPNPQQGICEAYRVIKPGGKALLIGPLEPQSAFSRWVANTWMLFPKEEEYLRWYEKAGFSDIQKIYVRPHWVRKDRYGIALVGTKTTKGASPLAQSIEDQRPKEKTLKEQLLTPFRVLIGSLAGGLFIPIALIGYLRASIKQPRKGDSHQLNSYQWMTILGILIALVVISWLILR